MASYSVLPTYKQGDTLRLIEATSGYPFPVGTLVTVLESKTGPYLAVRSSDGTVKRGVRNSRFELVKKADSEGEPSMNEVHEYKKTGTVTANGNCYGGIVAGQRYDVFGENSLGEYRIMRPPFDEVQGFTYHPKFEFAAAFQPVEEPEKTGQDFRTFKPGDRIRAKDGSAYNDQYEATVVEDPDGDYGTPEEEKVWADWWPTSPSWMPANRVEKVVENEPAQTVSDTPEFPYIGARFRYYQIPGVTLIPGVATVRKVSTASSFQAETDDGAVWYFDTTDVLDVLGADEVPRKDHTALCEEATNVADALDTTFMPQMATLIRTLRDALIEESYR